MRTKPVRFKCSDDTPVATYSGKWGRDQNCSVMLSEAEDLLEKASAIISETANMYGFGGEFAKLKAWLDDCQAYADARKRYFATGKDYDRFNWEG